jgi:hypothetical protein
VRPIAAVTSALAGLRSQASELAASLGDDRPPWLEGAGRTLGVVADPDMMVLDLARFVSSARQAGYERIALVGRRVDGRLVALPIETARLDDAVPPDTLRIAVGGSGIRLARPAVATVELERGDPGLRAVASGLLDPSQPAIAISATQPWIALGWLLPVIDTVIAAHPQGPPRCTLILPR